MDFGRVPGNGPVCDSFELFRIHLYPTIADNDAEVIDFFLLKVAFFGFKV